MKKYIVNFNIICKMMHDKILHFNASSHPEYITYRRLHHISEKGINNFINR